MTIHIPKTVRVQPESLLVRLRASEDSAIEFEMCGARSIPPNERRQ
jgi:hypothetical protein